MGLKLALAQLSRTHKINHVAKTTNKMAEPISVWDDETFGKGMIAELRADARLVRDYPATARAMSVDRHLIGVRHRAKHLAIFKCKRHLVANTRGTLPQSCRNGELYPHELAMYPPVSMTKVPRLLGLWGYPICFVPFYA